MADEPQVTPEAKALAEELKQAWTADFQGIHEKLEAEEKARGEASAETKQAFERADARLDEIEIRFQKAIEASVKSDKKERSDEAKAFSAWLTKGDRSISVDEAKVLVLSDSTQAGFLAPDDVRAELLKGVVEYSVLRPILTVYNTSRTSLRLFKRTAEFAAVWTGETTTRTETTGLNYGQIEIPTHEIYAMVDVSNQMLEDSIFDLEAQLGMEFSEQFGKAESTAFVSGSGVAQPFGFTQDSQVSTVNTASSAAFVANDMIELYYTPKTVYARQGTWLLNRATIKSVRKFQDSVGNYLWNPGLAGLAPATILDRPYIETPEMASTPTTTGSLTVAFGDFAKAYAVVDRVQLAIQRDPYTQNTAGATRFIARKRIGGQVLVSEAIKILKVQ